MATAKEWAELLLQNSKAVGSLLVLLITALGFTSFTAVEQHQELQELRTVVIQKVPVEVPVIIQAKEHGHAHDHKQIAKNEAEIKRLNIKVIELSRWH